MRDVGERHSSAYTDNYARIESMCYCYKAADLVGGSVWCYLSICVTLPSGFSVSQWAREPVMFLPSLIEPTGGAYLLLLFSLCHFIQASAATATTGNWSVALSRPSTTSPESSPHTQGTASSLRLYERPPLPLSNGSTYASSAVTGGQSWGTGIGLGGAGFATYGDATFKTICSSTDRACYNSCTSMAAPCSASHSAWHFSSLSYQHSMALKLGHNGSVLHTTSTTTLSYAPDYFTSYSITYITSIFVADVGRWNTGNIGTTTLTLPNPACNSTSCSPESRSLVEVGVDRNARTDGRALT